MWLKLHYEDGDEVIVNFDRVNYIESDDSYKYDDNSTASRTCVCFKNDDALCVRETLEQIEMAINAGLEMEHGGL